MSHKQCNTLHQKWHQVLSEIVVEAEQIAQSSQRERKMSVEQFVQPLVLGCLEPEETSYFACPRSSTAFIEHQTGTAQFCA